VVFHDLAVPWSRANVDHLTIGPTGVSGIPETFFIDAAAR
jgi:hypothetical protein